MLRRGYVVAFILPQRQDVTLQPMQPEKEGAKPGPSVSSLNLRLVLTLAAATGLTVANLYYGQPLLATMAQVFRMPPGEAGLVVTLSQLGYAAGLILLVPLGDVIERRRLIVVVLGFAVAVLAGEALAFSALMLLVAAFLIGVASVATQILVPFAASLASAAERGRVVGTVMSGLLLGVLLARTVAGLVAQAVGWRWVYGIASLLMALLAVVLQRSLPTQQPHVRLGYGALLRSVATLIRTEPILQRRSAYGALNFGAFSVFWTSAAFLLSGPPYHYTEGVIGLFGLVGVAGALSASVAGRLADRGWVLPATGGFLLVALLSHGLLALGGYLLAALIVGVVLLDLGVQGTQILNQSQIYRLSAEARTRVTSAYMTLYFLGGAIGSAGSSLAYGHGGWLAVCLVGAAFIGLAFLLWATELLRG